MKREFHYTLGAKLKRNKSIRFAVKKNFLKFFIRSRDSNPLVSQLARLYLSKYNHFFSVTNVRNVCVSTGRTRGTLKMWKLSRFRFRKFANKAYMSGLRRKSW